MIRGLFITLEGPDGCGKTTQSRLLVSNLTKGGFKVLHTREPGGTSFAENLRRILLNSKYNILPLAELLLYEASRAQHTEEVIRPALKEGKIVICERYSDATCAYQGYGRKLDLGRIKTLNKIATDGLLPDLTIVLDIPVKLGLKRARGTGGDRLEREDFSFHERVRRGYFQIAKKERKRIRVISATGSIQDVQNKILMAVSHSLRGKK